MPNKQVLPREHLLVFFETNPDLRPSDVIKRMLPPMKKPSRSLLPSPFIIRWTVRINRWFRCK